MAVIPPRIPRSRGVFFGPLWRRIRLRNLRPTGVPPLPERSQLTVMFCDLVGSTELAARMALRREILGLQGTV